MTIFPRLCAVTHSIYLVKYGATDDKEVSKFTKPNR
jgi:hypothetical protein